MGDVLGLLPDVLTLMDDIRYRLADLLGLLIARALMIVAGRTSRQAGKKVLESSRQVRGPSLSSERKEYERNRQTKEGLLSSTWLLSFFPTKFC